MDDIAGHNRERFGAAEVVDAYRGLEGLTPAEAQLFGRHVPAGARVLDLGIGTGRTTRWLRQRGATYQGIDLAPAMVDAARERHPDADLRVGDAADLHHLGDGDVDVVVFSYNGIDYLSDPSRHRALEEIRRVLAPGGTFVFSTHTARALVPRPSDLPGSVLRRLALAGYLTVRRAVRRLPTRAFWRGEGWIVDPASGGLRTHVADPRHVVEELATHGFAVVDRCSGDHPQRSRPLVTRWWYYVATPTG